MSRFRERCWARSAALWGKSRGTAAGDDGIGMILVLGYSLVITLLITVSVASVISTTKSGTSHVRFGQAGDTAEAGIDQVLAKLGKDKTFSSGVPVWPQFVNGFPSSSVERKWVLDRATELTTATPSLLQSTAQGQYYAFRPSNANTVYSVGWEPSKANAQRVRVLRNDYLFSGYSPNNAILAAGNVGDFSSFTLAMNTGTTAPPNVHSEGTTRCTSLVRPPAPPATLVNGVAGGCDGTGPSQTVPVIDPRALYTTFAATTSSWWDLCPGGAVRNPAATPCAGTLVGTATSRNAVRGWTYLSSACPRSGTTSTSTACWVAGDLNTYTGTYYVYQADADLTSASSTGTATIIAEATNNLSGCPATDGSIWLKQISLIPSLTYYSLVAGGSVSLDTASQAGDSTHPGVVAAQQGVTLHTSSSNGVYGAVIADNRCPGSTNDLQGSGVVYDSSMSLAFASYIRSTAQTELF